MKPSACLAALLFTSVACMGAPPDPGTQTAQSLDAASDKGGRTTIHYWLAIPPAAEKKPAGGYPVLLFLHGAGERGDNLDAVKKHGPPKLVGTKPELNRFIVVSPQCPAGRMWDLVALKALVDHTLKTTPADPDRVILTGLSMGGFATWDLLAAHPNLAAAAVPICGRGNPATAAKFKHVPIRVYHGAKDEAVPQKRSDEMVAALKAAGASPDYTIYPDLAHDSWTVTYDDAGLYEWMLAQKRVAK